MKKKNVLWIISMVVIIVVVASAYLLTHSTLLGNINGSYTEVTTISSEVSFSGVAGDRVKFSFRSDVESGNLDIILYDSEGIEVYNLDKAKELETFFTLSKTDTYTLVAVCEDFVGNFKVKASTARYLDRFFLNLLD